MTHSSRRDFLRAGSGAALLAGLPALSVAQAPLGTLRILCGYPAGSPPDFVARQVGEKLTGTYARTVIVDNKTGAAGRLVVDALKAAPPDGGTMLLTPASVMTMYPFIYRQLSYDPKLDFAPVSIAGDFSHALALGPMVPESVISVREFVAWCKANPGKASCGNPGAGSLPHFIGVLMGKEGQVELQHIAYRGTGPATLDLIAGQIAAAIGPEGNFLPYVESSRLRVVALTDARRSRFLPNVPTFTEQGFKTISLREWFGFFMPRGTAPSVVAQVASAVAAALQSPALTQSFAKLGMETTSSTPTELSAQVESELAHWGPVVRREGFSAES